MMKTITMNLSSKNLIAYPINIGSDFFLNPKTWLPENFHTKRLVIITDDNVNELYGKKLAERLNQYNPLLLSFTPGEKSKNYPTKINIEEKMFASRCDRETLILSLGGGIVGDMAGFIASTYMRGISYLQIPTTLLAMVDSSVGGKTGINTPQGKNLIGTFWQPISVVIDIDFLKTLPEQHMVNGLIEALKMFITHDNDFFQYAMDNIENILQKDIPTLQNIVGRSVKIKADIVSLDEKENHQRMVLNFGHTIGHALEKINNYELLHGYCVALGILVESKIAELLGFLSIESYKIIRASFLKLNISGDALKNISPDKIIEATQYDKKNKNYEVRYVLLKKIGQIHNEDNIFAYPVSDDVVKKALVDICEE